VFVYASADQSTADRHAGAVEAMLSRGEPKPVYFAPRLLPPASKARLHLTPLAFEFLHPAHTPLPEGRWSMWWPTRDDLEFSASGCVQDILRFVRATDGYDSFFFGLMLKHIDPYNKQLVRTEPPREPLVLTLVGPDRVAVAARTDRETGTTFLFDADSTSAEYRDRFWYHVARWAEGVRRQIDENLLQRDRPHATAPLRRFEVAYDRAEEARRDGRNLVPSFVRLNG
jgi:hypothetical protein